MAKFQWEATARDGVKRRGVMEAESAADVEARLRGDGMAVGKVRREGGLNVKDRKSTRLNSSHRL